jgi:hypothetical protein
MINCCSMTCRQIEASDYVRDQKENEDEAKKSEKHEVAQNCGEMRNRVI